ncbi:MAG: selenium metabolism-associated LysR family transcriptional regulator [Nitrospirota bacterium]
MEDHRLRAFCLVVEMKSFSKAAEAKFMTQSAMSHLIKSLEDDLGVKLLIRETKTVTTTPAGRLFYDYAKQILELYKKMENDVYSLVHKVKGPLYIGASPTVAAYLLPQVLYSFSKSYPEVRVEVSVSQTDSTVEYLYEGLIDLGIVEGNIRNSKIHLEEIAEDEIVLIASEDNRLTKEDTLRSEDLISQPFIMPAVGSGTRELVDDFLNVMKINPKDIKISMTLGNPELIVQMVQSGMGISFVSKWSVFEVIRDGSIKILNVSNKKLFRKFFLISLDKEPPTLSVRTFREFIRRYRFFIPF